MPKNIPVQIANLEAKLQELKATQIEELQERLREAQKVVRGLEQEIESLSGKPGSHGKRKRTSSTEVEQKIHSVLENAKDGLSQKEISEKSGLKYGTVVFFLRKNRQQFRTTGKFKSRRYFLK